jgi:serine/threonine-protein kinase
MTDRERWARLESVFLHALGLPTAERAAYLEEACGDDVALRREVEAVLAGHAAAGGDDTPDRLLTRSHAPSSPQLAPGDRLGAWRIEALIGRGGMGEVYRASRADSHYEQQVAIKVLRGGRDTAQMLQRFRGERQILARLQHPNIAPLIDGGVTDAGQPWLAMPFVDGRPITDWADARQLDAAGRLALVATVCDALRVAHANLIVHRDLKPGNILVTDGGVVHLLDFGIAKVLDADDPQTGDLLLLTPEHAAPEQFLGAPVTTSTDVYALGVLLYQLLTGTRPFQFTAPAELMRAVCELAPVPPSAAARDAERLRKANRAAPPVAAERLHGDLDAIVLKALRKEPERRYRSVDELADDLCRHAGGFPVSARPDTLRYVSARFVRRNRLAVAAAVTALGALLALAIVSVRSAARSRAQAAAVARERDVAVQVSALLESLFSAPTPYAVGAERRDTMRLRDFLAEATRKVQRDLGGQPLVQAQMLTVLGRAHGDLGLYREARSLFERAIATRRTALGPQALETASAERSLGSTMEQLGEFAAAESLLRRVSTTLSRDSATPPDERIRAFTALGNVLHRQGRLTDAEPVYREALSLARQAYATKPSELAGRLSDLGTVLGSLARYAEAETLLTQAIALEREASGPDGLRVATPVNNLASQFMRQGRFVQAETLMREAVRLVDRSLPDGHPIRASALGNLGANLLQQQRPADAEVLLRRSLALQQRALGPRHPSVGGTLTNLASAIDNQGRHAEALAMHRQAQALWTSALGATNPQVAFAHNNIGVSLQRLGRLREAVSEYQAALVIRRGALGMEHPLTLNVMGKLGQALAMAGERVRGLAVLDSAIAGYERVPGAPSRELEGWRQARSRLGTGRRE